MNWVSPGLEWAADHEGELTPVHHVGGTVLVRTQCTPRTGHLAEVVSLGLPIALGTEGQRVHVGEHSLARDVSVGDRVVPVVVHEPAPVQYGKGQIHGQRTSGRDVPVHVAIGVALGRPLRLLHSKLDQELEELPSGIEATCDVCGIAVSG